MKIEFFKIDGKSHKTTIIRQDGSVASVTLDTQTYFLHDLCHYVVEQELNYKKGFWGMLAEGYDFHELSGKENPLTEELKFIERVVGPVQSIVSGHLPIENFENSVGYLNTEITKGFDVGMVVREIKELAGRWRGVKYGESLYYALTESNYNVKFF